VDSITLYWLTNTGSRPPLLGEPGRLLGCQGHHHPVSISVFPDELYQVPQSWAERAYPDNLIHYNRLDRGSHFAAREQPELLAEELRTAFRSLGSRARRVDSAAPGMAACWSGVQQLGPVVGDRALGARCWLV
jgi:hypothetical protein